MRLVIRIIQQYKKEIKMDAITTLTSKNFTVNIYPDNYAEDPRTEMCGDNFTKMYCKHRRYDLGDNLSLDTSDCENWQEVEQALIAEYGEMAIIEPLSLHDHSGISISIGVKSGWDCGQVGFVFVTKEQVRKEYGVKRITKATLAKAQALLRSEVKEYDNYLTGEVYIVSCQDREEFEIDSCYVNGYDYAEKEAQLMLDNAEVNFAKQAKKDWDNFGLERMKSLFAQILAPSNQPHLQLFGI